MYLYFLFCDLVLLNSKILCIKLFGCMYNICSNNTDCFHTPKKISVLMICIENIQIIPVILRYVIKMFV